MKLTPVYQFIKSKLTDITELKLVTWWNGQTADNITHDTPSVYIEFPDTMQTETMGGAQMQNTEVTIRILLISSLITYNDGSIDESIMQAHEELAYQIYEQLQTQGFEFGDGDTGLSSMTRVSEFTNMGTPGMVVTTQDFRAVLMQRDRRTYTEITPAITLQKP